MHSWWWCWRMMACPRQSNCAGIAGLQCEVLVASHHVVYMNYSSAFVGIRLSPFLSLSHGPGPGSNVCFTTQTMGYSAHSVAVL